MSTREKINEIIDPSFEKSKLSSIYNYIMLAAIICGLLPLMFYTFVTALIMFNAGNGIVLETGKLLFDDFFEAFYWAASTLTTVGYGDVYPVNDLGRAISMISSLVGIAIIALPSGVITAAYMEELEGRKKNKK
jgi:voltage-gated potassium channel